MVKTDRKRLGILMVFPKFWIGGNYYLINIIKTLNYLPDKDKPYIYLFYNSDTISFANSVSYPYLEKVAYHVVRSQITTYIKTFLQSVLQGKNLFIHDIIEKYDLNALFPVMDFPIRSQENEKCHVISWYPDFQNKFYPSYFSTLQLFIRDFRFKLLLKNASTLILSSQDTLSHLERFYYKVKSSVKVEVLHFVSIMDDVKPMDIELVKQKCKIDAPYFMVCNSFAPHKNHIIILEAIEKLKVEGLDFVVCFTGEASIYGANYQLITDYIKAHSLEKYIKFLGLISRDEQVCLMQNSLSIIQPSEFEGWSTVVEDAKSLGLQLILTRLPVHQEQMGERAFYFNVEDSQILSKHIKGFVTGILKPKKVFSDYQDHIITFGNKFVEMAFSI